MAPKSDPIQSIFLQRKKMVNEFLRVFEFVLCDGRWHLSFPRDLTFESPTAQCIVIAANSAIGFDRPTNTGAQAPIVRCEALFSCPRFGTVRAFAPINGGRREEAERPAGPVSGRSTSRRPSPRFVAL